MRWWAALPMPCIVGARQRRLRTSTVCWTLAACWRRAASAPCRSTARHWTSAAFPYCRCAPRSRWRGARGSSRWHSSHSQPSAVGYSDFTFRFGGNVDASTVVELLRHGEPVGGTRIRGQSDDPLSERGWQQMWQAAGEAAPWQAIITSPLLRCAAFARALAERHGLPVQVEPRFKEIGFGAWEGHTPAPRARARRGTRCSTNTRTGACWWCVMRA